MNGIDYKEREASDIAVKIEKLREFFESGATRDYGFRRKYLEALYAAVEEEEENISAALKHDLNKSEFEAYTTEIGIVLSEIRYAIKNLKKWMKPKRIIPSLTQLPSSMKEYSEPFGLVLVMSPWNYPFQTTLSPIIGAIAAGNTVLIKPSEYSYRTSEALEKLFSRPELSKAAAVVRGGIGTGEEVLKHKFDYIFFTGSTRVGKIVMKAAAENLTPVILELGGKSPVIVDSACDIDKTAKRICFGKFLNSGQTCVAPDYVLVKSEIKSKLVAALIREFKEMIPDDKYLEENFPKIISRDHYERLKDYIEDEEELYGGITRDGRNQIYPTLLDEPALDSPVMTDEIFGPILPIISWNEPEEFIDIIKSKPKPLALYLFTDNEELQKKVMDEISFGGGCINDTISHIISPKAGFGGVGNSGMGKFHGKYTFDALSNKKTVLKKSWKLDIAMKYHPYKENALNMIKKILK